MGIHLDESLTWNYHHEPVKVKPFSAVFAIALSNVRNLLPSNIEHTLFNSLFQSFVEYGISSSLGGGRNESLEIKKISLLQKHSVRIIENAKTALHTDPLLFTYKILKLYYLTEFNQATFMSKYTKNLFTLHI